VLTDRSLNTNNTISQDRLLSSLPDHKRHQILAARGLLACGLLVHCLQSRHRVNYGINRSVNRGRECANEIPSLVHCTASNHETTECIHSASKVSHTVCVSQLSFAATVLQVCQRQEAFGCAIPCRRPTIRAQ
jgi:hypothetical protein